jgi:[ribosomal protein S5]-alanine N-acetyltransferase
MSFSLRPWNINDLNDLITAGNNTAIAANMTNKFPHPYTEEAGRKFLDFATTSTTSFIFAIEVDGKAVGSIGLHAQSDIHCKNMELGYWLAETHWGKGIVTGAIREIVGYGFANFDITRIFARPFGTNKASQKVLEKAGFKLEAKFEKSLFKNGEFLDEMVYGIRKE